MTPKPIHRGEAHATPQHLILGLHATIDPRRPERVSTGTGVCPGSPGVFFTGTGNSPFTAARGVLTVPKSTTLEQYSTGSGSLLGRLCYPPIRLRVARSNHAYPGRVGDQTERSAAGAFALPDSTLEARQTAHYYGTSASAELTASYHRAPAPVRIAIRSDADRPFATKPKPVHDRLERRPHDQQHASIFEHPLYARLQPARSEPAGT